MSKNKERIKELEKIIIALDTAFEVGDDCIDPLSQKIITDNEYDFLKKELYTLSPESKIFQSITASKKKITKNKIVHTPPMTSINKCNGSETEKEEILHKWFEDCRKIDKDLSGQKYYPDWLENFFCMSYKRDGIALSINYKNGKLISAGLRSKSGVDGINVTAKTKNIRGIPQKLPLPLTLTVRGEIETYLKVFEENNIKLANEGKETKSNARAYTAGMMNRKTAEEMKGMGLRFTAYNILNLENPPYKTEIERAIWAEKELELNFVKTISFNYDMLKTFEDNHRRLQFLVDGVVLSVNNLEYQSLCGQSGNKETGNPKGKIAFKFKDEIKKAIVKDIEWGTGRTATITPVLIFEKGIELEGTTVQRCTCHNLGILQQNQIGIGSEIEIIKSGKIIPKLHKVIKAKGEVIIPASCPSCGVPTKIQDGSNGAQSLICTNESNLCPAQNIRNFNHWLKIIGVKGIAEKNIEKIINSNLLKQISDFYKLTVQKLLDVGFTERTAVLIVARIWLINAPENIKDNDLLIKAIEGHSSEKIKIPMEKFFAGFGISSAGKEVGRILSQEIGDWNKIKTSTISGLEAFDGIGPIMAKEIVNFFQNNKDMIEDVEQYFKFEIKTLGGQLEGKTFVLSGALESKNGEGKTYFKNLIEKNGGTIKGSVSNKINYLVCGEGSGNKKTKAIKNSIPILTTKDLEKMLN